tara:strand:+ start:266 stop:502 length:237 start_codon:yes stop_codon:yes gene_type:complete
MAFVQTDENKKSLSIVSQVDGDGYYYLQIGSLRLYIGAGTPNAVVTAPAGSLAVDTTNTNLLMNTDGSTTWELVGGQS